MAAAEEMRNVRARTIQEEFPWNALKWSMRAFCTVPELTRMAAVSRACRQSVRQCPEWWMKATWTHRDVPAPHRAWDALAACPGLPHLTRLRLDALHLSKFPRRAWARVRAAVAPYLRELIIDSIRSPPTPLSQRAEACLDEILTSSRALTAYTGPLAAAVALRAPATLRALDVHMYSYEERLEAALRRLPALCSLRVEHTSPHGGMVVEHKGIVDLEVCGRKSLRAAVSRMRLLTLRASSLQRLRLENINVSYLHLPPDLQELRVEGIGYGVRAPPGFRWRARVPRLRVLALAHMPARACAVADLPCLRYLSIENAPPPRRPQDPEVPGLPSPYIELRALPQLSTLRVHVYGELKLGPGMAAAPLRELDAPHLTAPLAGLAPAQARALESVHLGQHAGVSVAPHARGLRRAELYNFLPDALRTGVYEHLAVVGIQNRPCLAVPHAASLEISSVSNMQQGLCLQCPETRALSIDYFFNLRAVLAPPGGLARLQTLDLAECPELTVMAINELIQLCPRLRTLRLRNPSTRATSGERHVFGLVLRHPQLTELDIRWDPYRAVYLSTIHLRRCPRLTALTLRAPKRRFSWERWSSVRLPPALERVVWDYNTHHAEMIDLAAQMGRVRTLEWAGFERRATSLRMAALETLTLTLSPMVRRMTLTGCPRLRSLSVLQHKRACKYPRLQDLAVPAATRTVRLPARCPRMREALRRVPSPAIVEI